MSHHLAIHHHKRKRERGSASNLYVSLLDNICVLFAVLMPLATIPQIYNLFVSQNAGGLSLWMWILYTIGIIPFLLYGFVHRVLHIIILNFLWLIVQVTMIVGIVVYS